MSCTLVQRTEWLFSLEQRLVVFAAVQEVVTRILEAQVNLDKQQPNPSDDSKLTKYVIRVLIPSTAAGAVIGKGGSNVRQMAESSGCKMKVSDSSDPFGTKERIVTVMGPSPENVIKSIQLVMRQMLLDPVQGGYASLSHVYSQPSTTAGQAPFPYGGPPPSIPSYGAQSIYQPQQQQQQPPMQDNRASFPTDYGQLSMQQHYQQPAPVPLNQSGSYNPYEPEIMSHDRHHSQYDSPRFHSNNVPISASYSSIECNYLIIFDIFRVFNAVAFLSVFTTSFLPGFCVCECH